MWVVVYPHHNQVAVSTDNAATWTEQSLAVVGGVPYQLGICYGNGLFVTVTYGVPAAHTSPDGVTWTQRSLPADRLWLAVAHGNGRFVAIAYNSDTAATSPDGITWTQRTLPVGTAWYAVAYGNGLFVAIASGGTVAATSPDGITWTQRTLPATGDWRSVAYGNGLFMAIASGGTVAATSPDGITWTQRTLPATGDWNSVAYGNGLFVAVRSYTTDIAVSSDGGASWVTKTGTYSGNRIKYGAGTFVVAGANGMSRSVPPTAYTNISGAISSSLALTGMTVLDDGDQYRAVVSAANAASVTSTAATLTVSG